MKRRFLALALCGIGVVADPVEAQQESSDSSAKLKPVTVTASRYPRSVFETPLAVTRLSSAAWSDASGYGLDGALSAVPGVLAQSRYGNNDIRLVIRGFGARGAGDRSNAGTSRGVRVLLDGFPETEPDGRTSFDAFDLAMASSIEVVRSNASALYGNAAGGVVNVSTMPEFNKDFHAASLQIGGWGLARYAFTGGSVLGPARLAYGAVKSSFDGYRANSRSDRSLLNTALSAPLGNATRLGVYLTATQNEFFVPGPLTAAQVAANPAQANATYLQRLERRDNRVGRLGVSLEHALTSNQSLTTSFYVQPKFLHRSERGTFRDFTRLHLGGSASYRAVTTFSPTVKGTLQVGVDQANQDGSIQFYGLSASGTRATDLRDNKREGASNSGIYAAEDFAIGERLGLSVGARYDDITYDYKSNITPKLNAVKHFTRMTPKLGLNYRLSATRSVYANIGGGLEAPAGNETDPAGTFGQDTVTALNPLLDAIRSTTLEVGTRHIATFTGGFVHLLSYDAALYTTSVTNEIVPYRGGRFYFTAGKVQRTGAELGATIEAAHGLSLNGALTLSKNTYDTYVVDSVHYGKPGKTADYSGNDVVGVPRVMLNATLGWAPSAAKGLRATLGMQQTGKYWADDANAVSVAGSTIWSLGLHQDRPLSLGALALRGSITVQNLTDKAYIGSAFLNPDVVGGVPVAFEPGLPRQVLISISAMYR